MSAGSAFLPVLRLGCLFSFALLGMAAWAGPTNSAIVHTNALRAGTNMPAMEKPIPRSVFVVPTRPEEGKDPFFPASSRLFSPPAAEHDKAGPHPAAFELRLSGYSGGRNNLLAIINGQSFAVGEEHDVLSGTVRVHVRCLSIAPELVVVTANGERRELRMRSGL